MLLAAGALAILLAGFLLGAGLTDGGVAPTRSAPDPAAAASTPSAPATGTGAATGQVPQQCVNAIQRADQAISYLIGDLRDRRLSESMLAFVETKNACLDLTTR